jgi:signal peptidase I
MGSIINSNLLLLAVVLLLGGCAAYLFLGPARERRQRLRVVVDLLGTLLVAALVAFVVQLWVVKPYRIPSASMENTFDIGDRVIAARFWYHFTDPARGDIVVFHPNGKDQSAFRSDSVASVTFVKRIIGLPGEWIRGLGGHVQICKGPGGSGCTTLKEPYVSSTQADFGPVYIPKGRYFLMGDNRAISDDSRQWGEIRRSQIIGRAFMIYWPPTRIRFF